MNARRTKSQGVAGHPDRASRTGSNELRAEPAGERLHVRQLLTASAHFAFEVPHIQRLPRRALEAGPAGERVRCLGAHNGFLSSGGDWKCDDRKKERNAMKSSTKDQAEGTFHELKGKVKEIAGKLSDDPKLEAEGTGEEIAGEVQQKIGGVKKILGK